MKVDPLDMPLVSRRARVKSAAIGLAIVAFAIYCGPWQFKIARAEPLANDACEALNVEQATLYAGGVKDDMAKGPDWAKGNVKPARLKDIQRFIEIEEQQNFRCGLASVKLNVPEPAVAEAGTAATPETTQSKPRAKPKARPKAASDAAAAPAEQPDAAANKGPATVAPKLEAKPKSKPKVDDAFRPPPVNPNADPFAKQVAPKG